MNNEEITSPSANVEPLNPYPNEGEAIHIEIEEFERVGINLSDIVFLTQHPKPLTYNDGDAISSVAKVF